MEKGCGEKKRKVKETTVEAANCVPIPLTDEQSQDPFCAPVPAPKCYANFETVSDLLFS